MTVGIDESRTQYLLGGEGDCFGAVFWDLRADIGDLTVPDPYIRLVDRTSGAIGNGRMEKESIKHGNTSVWVSMYFFLMIPLQIIDINMKNRQQSRNKFVQTTGV